MKLHRCGLRGAVGLSLSLFVLLDQKISDDRYRTLSFFFMGIVAFLTTLIQGATMAPILQVTQDPSCCVHESLTQKCQLAHK